MVDGFAGIDFANDVVTLLKTKWVLGSGGKKPEVTTQWNKKVVGLGTRVYNEIIIGIDAENPQIYSLMEGDATDREKFVYSWLHDVSITIDIRTNTSEERVLQMVDEVMRIIKTNTVPLITSSKGASEGDSRDYLQMLPEGITSLNEEYRNMFRYLVSVSAIIFNP